MRLPNGFGSVYKLSGKRRKPWIARKTVGWELDGDKARQRYITVGYYTSKQEALTALASYNANPYDLNVEGLTFEEVFSKWKDHHYKDLAPSTQRIWNSAYKNSTPLHKLRMKDIRVNHLEETIAGANVGIPTKKNMKNLYGMLYKFAIKHEIVEKNYAALCDNVKGGEPQIVRRPYSPEEIRALWAAIDTPFVDAILIGIYSGWRPQELATLKVDNVNLDEGTMFGGLKTSAGKNRIVPIHPAIGKLLERRLRGDSPYVFPEATNYNNFRARFVETNDRLGMAHKPHDTRHTFVTLAKSAGMDEHILKIIVGHSIEDITEKVYTHRTMEQLKEEIEKIKC